MAKFCTNCGKELVEGKCPSCSENLKTAKNNSFKDSLKKYWECLKKSFIKPMDVLKENNDENNFVSSLISIAISSILGGLFICLIIKETLGGFSGLIEIPYLKIFIVGFLLFAMLFSITALAAYIIFDKLFKSKTTIKKMFVLVGLSSIIISVALVITNILTFIALFDCINIIFILLALSSLLWIIYMVTGYENFAKKLDANKLGYAFAIIYSITFAVLYFLINNILLNILK